MSKLKEPVSLETAFGTYTIHELLGEGGAGRVFGGVDADSKPVAIKVLSNETASTDRKSRFKNEIAFLARNRHPNIVTVVDHGVTNSGKIAGPFYVMRRFDNSLRQIMRVGIPPGNVVPLFSQIIDGVEAAHLQGVIHRDLKPENVLSDDKAKALAIADFGIASFTEDLLATLVETAPTQRLANFQYAAPEQRTPGGPVTASTDVYALGLILNEMFTGAVPHGTDYRLIGSVSTAHSYLDQIVARMIRQAPNERPASIAELKGLIQRYESEAVSLQRISKLDGTVIKADEIDAPLADEPPRLVGADWNAGTLTLTLDRPVTQEWISALRNMGGYTSVMGKGPETFAFRGNQAIISSQEHDVQNVINHFKNWLPVASRVLKDTLERSAREQEAQRKEKLRREKEAEEQRLRVLRNIKI